MDITLAVRQLRHVQCGERTAQYTEPQVRPSISPRIDEVVVEMKRNQTAVTKTWLIPDVSSKIEDINFLGKTVNIKNTKGCLL